MDDKKLYFYISETMRDLIDSANKHRITKLDIVTTFHDGKNYIIIYEM